MGTKRDREYDDLVASASDYRKEILQLIGVDILDSNGDYKSAYQILTEMADVWDQISDTSRAALIEDIGGKRGTSVASSIAELDEMEECLWGDICDEQCSRCSYYTNEEEDNLREYFSSLSERASDYEDLLLESGYFEEWC